MTHRVDLFTTIHKAIRALLFDTTALASRVDYTSVGDASAAAAAAERLVAHLHEHAHHEDVHVLPVLARCAPNVAARLTADHESFDRLERDVVAVAAAVRAASGDEERLAAGRELRLALTRMTAAQLPHMDVEETDAAAALYAAYSPQELAAVHQGLIRSIAPARFLEWMAIMLPVISVDERAEMLAGMKQGAPPEVFAAVAGVARRALAAEDWTATCERAGIAA